MRPRVPAAPVVEMVEQGSRRTGSGEGAAIAGVDPEARRIGLALGSDRHDRIVAVQSLGGQDMGLDQPVERHQGAALIGERRGAER